MREGRVRLIGTGLWRNSCGRGAEDECVGADCRGSGSRPCRPPFLSPSGNRTELFLSLSLSRSRSLSLAPSFPLSLSISFIALRIHPCGYPGRLYIAGAVFCRGIRIQRSGSTHYKAGPSYSLPECTRSVEQLRGTNKIAARPSQISNTLALH